MTAGAQPQEFLVIAHRGASGYLPEHTLAAKALAHAMGADFLEQDVVATRDGALLVFHDLWLDDMTDVATRFPGRCRADGKHYCFDFDLDEIRRLRVTERRTEGGTAAKYPGRFPSGTGSFGIPTLDEELALVAGLNSSTGRHAGVYTEIKEPGWHHAAGFDLSKAVLAVLARHGYARRADAAFVQCFDDAELRRVRMELRSDLRLIRLIDSDEALPDASGLREMAAFADGIGPGLGRLLREPAGGRRFVAEARAVGLAVHVYTARADALPPGVASFDELMRRLTEELGVTGVFTDFPDLSVRCLNRSG
jgi:glycerophosphoryl diester phosphodiesterase